MTSEHKENIKDNKQDKTEVMVVSKAELIRTLPAKKTVSNCKKLIQKDRKRSKNQGRFDKNF